MGLEAIKQKEGEKIVAVLLPEQGKITVEDLARASNVRADNIIKKIRDNNIKVHALSGNRTSNWIIDLEDFWAKT